jgi:NAD(P)-dependent dehydrogenase (short-subunit alcohol dehydrogenase family)
MFKGEPFKLTNLESVSFNLKGKVSIVTGAGQGIGEDIATRLAQHKSVVIVADIDFKKAKVVATKIRRLNLSAIPFEIDVSKKHDVNNMINFVVDKYSKIDFLVNNAGVRTIALAKDMSEEEWDWILDVNLKGVFLCSQSVANHMIKQKYGNILNISSVLSFGAMPARAHYCSSKSGVSSLTRVMATELAPYNIRVNAVAPGVIETPMAKDNPPNGLQKMISRIPMARLGKAHEISYTVLFLLSDASSYITGQTVFVDGGWTSNVII